MTDMIKTIEGVTDDIGRRMHFNTAVAKILLRKYQMLRIAFLVGGLDFILILVRHGGLM